MKTQVLNYTFNKTAKTITFNDYITIRLESILMIMNVTRGKLLFSFADPLLSGTVNLNVLTLGSTINTSSMADLDALLIFYDDETAYQLVDLARALSGLDDVGNEYDTMLAYPARRSDAYQASPVTVQTTSAVIIKAATTAKKTYVTDLTISTDGAGACDLLIQDDAGTPVVLERIFLPATATTLHLRFVTPKATTAGQALQAKASSATPKIYVSAGGYVYA